MTEGVLDEASLARLAPTRVSPALLTLVGEDAPTRAVLCAGAGHFAVANVTLTHGLYIGNEPDAGEQVAAQWSRIIDRAEEIVPSYGFTQAKREVASAIVIAP